MKRIEINEVDFKKIINAVKHSIARDDSRPILKYIQIRYADNKVVISSLDGYRASRITMSLENCESEPFTCFIKPFSFKPTRQGLSPVVIESDDNFTTVEVPAEFGKLKYSFSKPNGDYVNVDNVYNDAAEHDREVAINARYLAEALKSCASITIDRDNLTIIESKENSVKPVIVRSKFNGILNEQLILPIRIRDDK